MSFNERWGSFKIVGPLDSSREEDLVGGLRNAIERGADRASAKQSFINAGYKSSEVDAAMAKVSLMNKPIVQPTNTTSESKAESSLHSSSKSLPVSQKDSSKKTIFSKKLIIILVVISALILGGAATLGIFWNKLFG